MNQIYIMPPGHVPANLRDKERKRHECLGDRRCPSNFSSACQRHLSNPCHAMPLPFCPTKKFQHKNKSVTRRVYIIKHDKLVASRSSLLCPQVQLISYGVDQTTHPDLSSPSNLTRSFNAGMIYMARLRLNLFS